MSLFDNSPKIKPTATPTGAQEQGSTKKVEALLPSGLDPARSTSRLPQRGISPIATTSIEGASLFSLSTAPQSIKHDPRPLREIIGEQASDYRRIAKQNLG